MRLILILAVLACAALHAETALPWHETQPGFHDATRELATYCAGAGLGSQARRLARAAGDEALLKSVENTPDHYTAAAWAGFLDRREAVQRRRALGAAAAGQPPRTVLWIDPDHAPSREAEGMKWLDGLGWLSTAERARLAPLVITDPPKAAPREAGWDNPWVLVRPGFTLVTDLPWARAVKYSAMLEQFHAFYFATLGDVVPRRGHPNVVWCCRKAADFVALGNTLGQPLSAENSGMHLAHLGYVVVNAERADEVGRRNRARDTLARTLFHECAHRLTESGLRGRDANLWALATAPEHAWIVESIAIVFEDLHFEGDKPVLKGLEDQRRYTIGKFWKGQGKPPALEAVLNQGARDFATDQPISSAEKYALAGSVGWCCLFEKPAHRAAYLALLVDYYRGDTTGRDFATRFGMPPADFEKAWANWVVTLA